MSDLGVRSLAEWETSRDVNISELRGREATDPRLTSLFSSSGLQSFTTERNISATDSAIYAAQYVKYQCVPLLSCRPCPSPPVFAFFRHLSRELNTSSGFSLPFTRPSIDLAPTRPLGSLVRPGHLTFRSGRRSRPKKSTTSADSVSCLVRIHTHPEKRKSSLTGPYLGFS